MEVLTTRFGESNKSMSEQTIKIDYDIEDTYFKFPQEAMADIINALHTNDKVTVHFTEGVALEELNYKEKKFLDICRQICTKNNWPLDKIHFVLPNLTQDKDVWPSIEYGGAAILHNDSKENIFLGLQNEKLDNNKHIQKTFGIFVNRSNWDRLLLSSHLYSNHAMATLQTYRKNLNSPADMIELGLDQMFLMLSSSKRLNSTIIKEVSHFLENLPFDQGVDWNMPDQQSCVDKSIMSWYNQIFIDVVCEKMITGQAFFPTEKTARPIASKTPFVVMAAPNYLKNLRKIGFKTFNKFWDESYDYQQGVQRIESIKEIIDSLGKLSEAELNNLYHQMQPILQHNYDLYMQLTGRDIVSKF